MSINQSFEDYSIKELRDLRSRKALSDLLQAQIDVNQELKAENLLVRQNQRKLLLVLENKDRQLASRPYQQASQSGLEFNTTQQSYMRQLELIKQLNKQLQVKLSNAESNLQRVSLNLENTKEQKLRLEDKVGELQTILRQREEEVFKIKNKRSEVHDKIEKENEQYVQEILRINQKFMQTKQAMESLIQSSERQKKELRREIINLNQNLKGSKRQLDESSNLREKQLRDMLKAKSAEIEELSFKLADYRDEMSLLREKLQEKELSLQEKEMILHNHLVEYEEATHLRQLLEQRSLENSNLNSQLQETRNKLVTITEEESQLESLKSIMESIKYELNDKITSNKHLEEELSFKENVIAQLQGTIKQLQGAISQKLGVESSYHQLRIQLENKELSIEEFRLVKEELMKTISKKDENLVKLKEASLQVEREYKKEKEEDRARLQKVVSENRALKEQLSAMQKQLQTYIRGIEDKYKRLQIENEALTKKYNSLFNQKEAVTSRYSQQQTQIEQFEQELKQKERQILNLNRKITQSSQQSQLRLEISKLRKQLLELKAKISSLADTNSKMKQQNAELTHQTMRLTEQNAAYKEELEAMQDRLEEFNAKLEEKVSANNKGEAHLRELIEEKRGLELEISKYNNDLRTYKQLLQTAKNSKAQEIINLNRQVAEYRDRRSKDEIELQEMNSIIESCNRDKLNLMRQNTLSKETTNKLMKQNSQLKKEISELKEELTKSHKLCQEFDFQLAHMSEAYEILENANRKVERYSSLNKPAPHHAEDPLSVTRAPMSIQKKISNIKKDLHIDF